MMKVYAVKNEVMGYRWRRKDALQLLRRLYEYEAIKGTAYKVSQVVRPEDGRKVWEVSKVGMYVL